MKTTNQGARHSARTLITRMAALLLALCFLPVFALAEDAGAKNDDWITFLLICNEGMDNDKGNAGNTLMMVGMNPDIGKIRLVSFTWDTFVDYEGYDVPQKLDMAYRNNGPEEAVKILNANFGTNITKFMSLNYLNLANLIDNYGGVTVDITRVERNSLNGMVDSKQNQLKRMVEGGLLGEAAVELLASKYYLEEYGPDTLLNGLQAVGFGWLQYDSVYNCCERDLKVISNLFESVSNTVAEQAVFYTNETGEPNSDEIHGRRVINLDDISDSDREFLLLQIRPIFDMSYNNLTEEDIEGISETLVRTAYQGARQGVNIFENLDQIVLPLEATNEYDIVAGATGHLVDKEANAAKIQEFLYSED